MKLLFTCGRCYTKNKKTLYFLGVEWEAIVQRCGTCKTLNLAEDVSFKTVELKN